MQKLDEEFKALHYVWNIKEDNRSVKLEIIIANVVVSSLIAYFITTDVLVFYPPFELSEEFIGDTVLNRLPAVYSSYTLLQFCSFLAILKQRFKWLNRNLKKIARICSKTKGHSMFLYVN